MKIGDYNHPTVWLIEIIEPTRMKRCFTRIGDVKRLR